ncbi:hypothetical protein FHQ18_02425 [Deferribacter autotrophicus]|uniref:Uncharacterized protein n=1 Tax=Deferribacter autotrophicus TaxID=500465 RepID=A0A5A8F5N5_9BACT|nr:hypothetical protein [Deferribacter autotrophicus]KAA0258825.1 hypothetical protein FHQ18_02425 [Deferribacter autotrophicus]
MNRENKTMKIKYIKSPDFKQYYINGVYGGLNVNGLVSVKLYYEDFVLPDESELEFSENSEIPSETIKKSDYYGVRQLLAELIMVPEQAKLIGQFLVKIADDYFSEREQKGK